MRLHLGSFRFVSAVVVASACADSGSRGTQGDSPPMSDAAVAESGDAGSAGRGGASGESNGETGGETGGSAPSATGGGKATSADAGSVDAAGKSDAAVGAPTDGGVPPAPPDAGPPQDVTICASCGPCEETKIPTTAAHVTGTIDYPDPPPMGGDHNACWTTWGVHDTPVGAEHWVHNLEHGGIVYLYNCPDGCSDEVGELAQFVTGKTLAVLTAYSAMPKRFAVVSWGHRLMMDCFDKASLLAFYAKHVDRGPESITSEPPATCP